jgi:hypothetical protein
LYDIINGKFVTEGYGIGEAIEKAINVNKGLVMDYQIRESMIGINKDNYPELMFRLFRDYFMSVIGIRMAAGPPISGARFRGYRVKYILDEKHGLQLQNALITLAEHSGIVINKNNQVVTDQNGAVVFTEQKKARHFSTTRELHDIELAMAQPVAERTVNILLSVPNSKVIIAMNYNESKVNVEEDIRNYIEL